MIFIIDTFDFLPFLITFPNLFPASRPVVLFRVLCGELHTHNTFRDADIPLLYMGNLCYYVDRAWGLVVYSFTNGSH